MEKRSESFGRILKAGMAAIAYLEGKTQQAVEEDLGGQIGVAGSTLQRYKAGYIPPDPRSVESLAEACVQRGLFGRLWLERFLEAARFSISNIRVLIARLLPEALPMLAARGPRLNLPPPTYSRFIMRSEAYDAVMAGLGSELALTVIVSLGGMGKTSLARAVAGACLEGLRGAPRFVAAVWLSDKDRPGTTNLSTVLDEVARVLDYPGIVVLPFAERQREVEELLRRQQVLLVIDNAETISDGALLTWLSRLPGPSKALATSRVALPAYLSVYPVGLGPLTAAEARALIAEWLPRSRLRGIPGVLEQLTPIAAITGGNAKAIELALGLLQHRTIDEVLADLVVDHAGIFDELFARAWDLLDEAARRVLLVLPLFPTSATAEALAYCTDLSTVAFLRSADNLANLSLIDIERADLSSPPRYNAHPLVRAFAQARLAELAPDEQHGLQNRWLTWCVDVATAVGFCWDDLDRLNSLDEEHATVQAAIAWASQHQRDQALILLVEGARYYYNVRGQWGDEELFNNERRVAAARRLADPDNEALALAHHVQILCKQGRITEAAPLMEQLAGLAEARYRDRIRGQEPPQIISEARRRSLYDDAAFEYGHALAHYAYARSDMAEAEHYWRELLDLGRLLGGQKYVINRRWLATVLLRQGRRADARQLYAESLADARRIRDLRSVIGNTLKLAALDLDDGELDGAAVALDSCRAIAIRYRDRRRLAECHRTTARLLTLRGNAEGAIAELSAALDLFERLGMRRDTREVRQEIENLNRQLHYLVE